MRRIVFVGNKDHGKSTLIGRILVDLGVVKPDRLETIRPLSGEKSGEFEFAHILDSFAEERARGMTMDTASAVMDLAGERYELIDVPGHEELIGQMLSGVWRAEHAVLVASVKEGIEPQTLQHCQIVKFLGIPRLIVALNKMDICGYSEFAARELIQELAPIIQASGYGEPAIRFVPVSAVNGDNVVNESAVMKWYRGPTLLTLLRIANGNEKENMGSFVFSAQDAVRADGGILMIGRVESGTANVGQTVWCFPVRSQLAIKKMFSASGEPISVAGAAANIGILVDTGDTASILGRGTILASEPALVETSDLIRMHLFFVRRPTGGLLAFRCGFDTVAGKIIDLKDSPPVGKTILLTAELARPITIMRGAGSSLGRIVVKDKNEIIGLGIIS